MKKRELVFVGLIALLALGAIFAVQLLKSGIFQKKDGIGVPQQQAKGEWVAIVHREKIELWFDSGVDGEYTVQGDYGKMVVEVKDNKWHVKEVECPNHVCEKMGWDDGTNYVPITCIPNDIYIGTTEWVQSFIGETK